MKALRFITHLGIVALAVACTEPVAVPALPEDARFSGSGGPQLIVCPTGSSQSATATISASLGGALSVGGFRIAVPPQAILQDTRLALTVTAGDYVEVDIKANGQEHFQFAAPVEITLDYGRCEQSYPRALKAAYIDSGTKAILQVMGGEDDKTARRVRFQTDHLSGYAVVDGDSEEEQPPE